MTDELLPKRGYFSDMDEMPSEAPQGGALDDGTHVEYQPGGDIVVAFNGAAGTLRPGAVETQHADNLALIIDSNELNRIAGDVLSYVDADRRSRDEWEEPLRNAAELLGIKSTTAAVDGGSEVTHPMVHEAALQFAARAIAELFPPTGPAKVTAPGDAVDSETEQRRARVEEYMNFFLTVEDRGYRANFDQMLFLVGVWGCMFRKVWIDPTINRPRSRWISPKHFHVPYNSSDLASASRYTHEYTMHINDVRRAMDGGRWRKVDLGSATVPDDEESLDDPEAQTSSYAPDDDIRTFYECALYRHLLDDDREKPEKPYLVTVDKASQQVVAVYRDWDEADEQCNRLQSIVQYDLLPGFGLYGHGFLHLIGKLGAAAGGAMRALLDAALLANMQGGFTNGDAGAGALKFAPGEFKKVQSSIEDLSKAFFTMQFKGPEPALFQAFQLLVETGQRLATTTDMSVGDAKNTGPVGTTVALIEQAGKVFNAVHLRLHAAQAQELQLLYDLLGDTDVVEYPYKVRGKPSSVMREDFRDDLDVVPVSDPNITSSTQRLAIAQAGLQLVDSAPDLYGQKGRRLAHRTMLHALKVNNVDEWLPERQTFRLDPVSENQLLMTGKPVGAFPEQNHQAHIALHMQMVQMVQSLPAASQVLPAVMAHLAEHLALAYRATMQQAVGQPLPAFDADSPEDMDPQTEAMVTMALTQVMGQVNAPMQQLIQMLGGGQDQQQAHQQELQAQQAQHQAELQQAQQKHEQAMQQAAQKHQQDMAMREARAQADAAAKQIITAADAEAKKMMAEVQSSITAAMADLKLQITAMQAAADEARKAEAFEAEQERASSASGDD